MEAAPQDFVNSVSSYLHWQDVRMICDNIGLFDKAYYDKPFLTDIAKASQTSQTIRLRDLVSSLYSSYAIIQWTDSMDIDIEIVANPTARQIISLVEDWIKGVQELDSNDGSSRMLADTNKDLTLLVISMDRWSIDLPSNWKLHIVSNEDNIREIGNYLCDLHVENIDIDAKCIKFFIGSSRSL
jgi:hypothetical protein